jgi:hypothetical protein
MSTRALTLAMSLLGAAAVSVALPATSGCSLPRECGGVPETRPIELGVSVDLHAVAATQKGDYEYVAVGAEGTVVAWGGSGVQVSTVGTVDLRGVAATSDSWWVVGDAGTVAVSGDQGQTWILVTVPTTADLRAVIRFGSQVVVVGDEVLLVQAADGMWIEMAAPDGSWGQLRALYHQAGRLYTVGLGGVIWSTVDAHEWIAESSGTEADLFAIGGYSSGSSFAAVGAAGTILVRKLDGWERIDNDESVDLVASDHGYYLGADGALLSFDSDGKLSQSDTFPAGARALVYDGGILAVGDSGAAFTYSFPECYGRPFVVDGRPHTASLRWGDAPTASRASIAEAWARAGLYEHASVASFARFALELLALGAPPRLLRDLQAAIGDELRHARVCFELARRFAGVTVGPGAMPIAADALVRIGDPIATAIGLFEEACVDESVAACAAAEAAARTEDPDVRRVLEGIAVDERRHAVAGWAALRWLLDTYGEQVRQPLRAALARLRPSTLPRSDDFDEALMAFGRLSPRDHAALRNHVLRQLVCPLAHAMLFPNTLTPTEAIP